MSIPPTTDDYIRMLVCRSQCDPFGLQEHRRGVAYKGPIRSGMVFEWEPDKPHAAETCKVVAVDGDKIATVGTRPYSVLAPTQTVWNDESRFREAVVVSLLKIFPVAV